MNGRRAVMAAPERLGRMEMGKLSGAAKALADAGYRVVTADRRILGPWMGGSASGGNVYELTMTERAGKKSYAVSTVRIGGDLEKTLIMGDEGYEGRADAYVTMTSHGLGPRESDGSLALYREVLSGGWQPDAGNKEETGFVAPEYDIGSSRDLAGLRKLLGVSDIAAVIKAPASLAAVGESMSPKLSAYMRDVASLLAVPVDGKAGYFRVPGTALDDGIRSSGAPVMGFRKPLTEASLTELRKKHRQSDAEKRGQEILRAIGDGSPAVLNFYRPQYSTEEPQAEAWSSLTAGTDLDIYDMASARDREELLSMLALSRRSQEKSAMAFTDDLPRPFRITAGAGVAEFRSVAVAYKAVLQRLEFEAAEAGGVIDADEKLALLSRIYAVARGAQDDDVKAVMARELAPLSPASLIDGDHLLLMPYRKDGGRYEIEMAENEKEREAKETEGLEEVLDMTASRRETGDVALYKAVGADLRRAFGDVGEYLGRGAVARYRVMTRIARVLNGWIDREDNLRRLSTTTGDLLLAALDAELDHLEGLALIGEDRADRDAVLAARTQLRDYLLGSRILGGNPLLRADRQLSVPIVLPGDHRGYPTIRAAVMAGFLPPGPASDGLRDRLAAGGSVTLRDIDLKGQAMAAGHAEVSKGFFVDFAKSRLRNAYVTAYMNNPDIRAAVLAMTEEETADILCFNVPFVNEYIAMLSESLGKPELGYAHMVKSYAGQAEKRAERDRTELEASGIASHLSAEQKAVIGDRTSRRILINATAGAGKTTTLIELLASRIASDPAMADRVVVFSFTNTAADEFRDRLARHPRLAGSRMPENISTAHAYALTVLRRYHKEAGLGAGFSIFTGAETDAELVDYLGADARSMTEKAKRDECQRKISLFNTLRSRGFDLDRLGEQLDDNREFLGELMKSRTYASADGKAAFWKDYRHYREWLAKNGSIDFTDILTKCVELLRKNEDIRREVRAGIGLLMIDEYQDTNRLIKELECEICSPECTKVMVGDYDQSIYSFNGADSGIIRRTIKEENPALYNLSCNQRVKNRSILDFAAGYVTDNLSDRPVDMKIVASDRAEALEKPVFSLSDTEGRMFEAVYDRIMECVRKNREAGYGDYEGIAVEFRGNREKDTFRTYALSKGIPVFKPKENPYTSVTAARFANLLEAVMDPSSAKALLGLYISVFGSSRDEWHEASTADELITRMRSTDCEAADNMETLIGKLMLLKDRGAETPLKDVAYAFNDLLENAGIDDRKFFDTEALAVISKIAGDRKAADVRGFLDDLTLRRSNAGLSPEMGEDEVNSTLCVTTIHGVKGCEFRHVLVCADDRSFKNSPLSDEVRAFYVGFTRAIDTLALFCNTANGVPAALRNLDTGKLEMDEATKRAYDDGFRSVLAGPSASMPREQGKGGIARLGAEISMRRKDRQR